MAAVVGHLLFAAARGGSFGSVQESGKKAGAKSDWMFRSRDQRTFRGKAVSREKFEQAIEVLKGLQFIEIRPGYWDAKTQRGHASRYRAKPPLVDEAIAHGLAPGNLRNHFRREPVVEPLILKSTRVRTGKAKGLSRRVAFPEADERARLLRDEVELVNDLVHRSRITGSDLRGFQRVFNLGDQDGHDWRFGGRVFAVSADDRSYQQMKEEERLRLLINGEPVVELDLGACYLTIALGRYGDRSRDFAGVDRRGIRTP